LEALYNESKISDFCQIKEGGGLMNNQKMVMH